MAVCAKVSNAFVGVVGKKMEVCVSMLGLAQVACEEALEYMILVKFVFIGFLYCSSPYPNLSSCVICVSKVCLESREILDHDMCKLVFDSHLVTYR